MRGITDTYWTEIAETLSSKEGFLAYMMESDAYKNASDDEKAQMVYNWETMYDDWIAAKKIRDEAVNWDHVDDFEAGSPAQGDGKRYKHTYTITGSDANGNPLTHSGEGVGTSPWAATGAAHIVAEQQAASRGFAPGYKIDFASDPVPFMRGGYVDYTGLAMVHGSPSRPEAFLSAADTELVRTMLDTWHFVAGRPTIMNVDGALGHGGTANTFGDISITITEASFADDADYEEVAKRVGEAFTKELSKQGFRTATFNF